jgi:hypothetical protein
MIKVFHKIGFLLLMVSLLMSPVFSFATDKNTIDSNFVEVNLAESIAHNFVLKNNILEGNQVCSPPHSMTAL